MSSPKPVVKKDLLTEANPNIPVIFLFINSRLTFI
jgi:hypothetical protein